MIRQKMDSLSFELLSRMAHMMTRMTHMTRWLAGSLAHSLSRPTLSGLVLVSYICFESK